MSFAIASLLKPFAAVGFFFVAYLLARVVAPLIPGGRLKDVLYDRSLRRRHPWKFALGFMCFFYGTLFLVLLIGDLIY